MMKKNKIRIYIDMDNTIADYSSAYIKDLKDNPGIKYPQSQYGFFLKLDVLEFVDFHINSLVNLGFDVWLLTKPSVKNPLCYTEKRVWVEKNLGMRWAEKLIICPDKSLMIGDILIDDSPWNGFKGEQLLFGSEAFPDWISVNKYIMDNYKV